MCCLFFKIGNGRVLENIFPKKSVMIYENSIIFKKLVKTDSNEKFYYKKH